MIGIRLLIDTSMCIGCRACQIACQQWHSLPAEDTAFAGTYQNPPDMTAANLTVTKFFEVVNTKMNWLFFKDQCRHCDDPPCTECPLKAIIRQSDGVVRIDSAKCFPDRCSRNTIKPCQEKCEFEEIPRYRYKKAGISVATKMRKCDFCYDRLAGTRPNFSKRPACEMACPSGAMSFGNADPIMAKALSRLTYLKTHGLPQAKIYPEDSGSSTHVIWILPLGEGAYNG
jgi:Fe-S-cluster-containing dehydrogenase component